MRGLSPEKRKSILDKWCSIKGITLRKLAKLENVSVGAVQNAIKKFGQEYTFVDKPKSGRKPGSSNPNLDRKIVKAYKTNKEASVRDLAKKLGTSIGMVQRAKQRNNLKTYKKQRQPKRSEKQQSSVKSRVRKLYDSILTRKNMCVIMDDETYVKLDYKSLPGPQYYTVQDRSVISDSEKSIFTEKFGKKIMVWQAICECGLKSTPFFTTSTMTADNYIKECLNKRLLPMVRKHSVQTVFWPDLASCHYGSKALQWYEEKNINFVPKAMNPPNCPNLRPIERFWAIIKAKLRKNGRSTDSKEQFRRDWNRVTKSFDQDAVRSLMSTFRQKVRKLARNE